MSSLEQWLPLGSSDLEFDVCTEMRRAMVDLLRRREPRTVLGMLIANENGVRLDDLADRLDKPKEEVEWTIERLEEDDLCERITQDGVTTVVGFAAYSVRNSV
jgi:predicted transcriptional regulator